MDHPPIPTRIPPLSWRKPALLWTPLALAVAIGWPAALLQHDGALQKLAVVAGAAVFALALVTLGAAWAFGRAPRTRREVVLHVVIAGALASLIAPFVLTTLLALVADYEQSGAGARFTFEMSLAAAPLGLVIGLPISLASGIVFAWLALTRRGPAGGDDLLADRAFRDDVQPFR